MSGVSSPSKRRKTKYNMILESNRYQDLTTSSKTQMMWPPNLLPVELFTLIISYLPRSSIQDMRLVNKEFEQKVSEYLFRVVVVPFKPEIYGINPEPALSRTPVSPGAVMLQDKGMRVFQGFGRRIRKFAMSFEIEESKLANPPVKSDSEDIETFWGSYKWPYKGYNRYEQLEGLEQTADETRTMAKALRFIESAKHLGLSIDGGLGWLAGPDVNQRVINRNEKPIVFGESRFVPEPKVSSPRNGKSTCRSDMLTAHERSSREVGVVGDDSAPPFRLYSEIEQSPTSTIATLSQQNSFGTPISEHVRRILAATNVNNHQPTIVENSTQIAPMGSDDEGDEEESLPSIPTAPGCGGPLSKSKPEHYPLKPNDLTNAQREMLLEIEWAQRAFMQSYAIAIIDNPSTFHNIESLTIARLPNRHLPTLRREDFWDSLPELRKLSLALIPDWRDVVKLPTTWVQDNKLFPSQSVAGAYQLLSQQISHRRNIKTLHFEWLCGGEYAPGLFSRNQHILAAPLVPKAMDMMSRSQAPDILTLPHVENLSLRNCWASPHVIGTFTLSLRKAALLSLNLDSVSLTAPVPANAQPLPVNAHAAIAQNAHQPAGQAAANNLMANFQGLIAAQNPNQLQPVLPAAAAGIAAIQQLQQAPIIDPVIMPEEWLATRTASWPHLINALTPSTTLADIAYLRDLGPQPTAQEPTKLRQLKFTSCGYVRLPLDFDQTVLDPPDMQAPQAHSVARRVAEIECHMMKPSDPTLGVIINYMSPVETATLENAWNMTTGWRASRSELISEARLDGILNAGRGRFDGLIEVASSNSSNH